MYRRPSKKQELIKRTLVYVAMTLLVIITVAGLIFVILGYRIDTDNGRVERSALLQYKTIPSGASVAVDGQTVSTKTPAKSTVIEGSHKFVMQRDGYEAWQNTLDIKAGTLTWLNYARLVPKNRPIVSVANYPILHASLGTINGQTIMIQQDASLPTFRLVDVRSDDIKTYNITLPATLYSDATTVGITHTFKVDSWDSDGRYLLVEHAYSNKNEWLVVDTQDVNLSKNITKAFDVNITYATFSGTSGNILYTLSDGDIRKLDLSASTMTGTLVSHVSSFELFETNVITYIGVSQADPTKRIVGLYREGDSSPHILRTVTEAPDVPLHVTTSHYFNQDYVAITDGNKVDITNGSYPSSGSSDASSLSQFASFKLTSDIKQVSFSPTGFYLMVQSGSQFASYDIEHQRVNMSSVSNDQSATVAPLKWLDDDHLWSDFSDDLSMRDFDGSNAININAVASGYDVTLTHNDRFIYSIGKTSTGYQLQRVRMILP